jgi:cystathionine beta-synthase
MYNDYRMLTTASSIANPPATSRPGHLSLLKARHLIRSRRPTLLVTAWQRMNCTTEPVAGNGRRQHRRHRRRERRALHAPWRRGAVPRSGIDCDGEQADKLDDVSDRDLWLVFDRGHVAIVVDGDKFVGLITRIDLLNYLRRRVQ